MTEDLESNPFFQALRNSKKHYFRECSENLYAILVPQKSVAQNLVINDEVIRAHIAQPSQFYLGEFVTKTKKEIIIENNLITKKMGKQTIKIMGEELYYNDRFEPFHVYVIETPLEGEINKPANIPIEFPKEKSSKSHIEFLLQQPSNQDVLKEIDKKIDNFEKSYVFLQGYLQNWRDKIQEIYEFSFKILLGRYSNNDGELENDEKKKQFSEIVENYIMGKLHKKIYSNLQKYYQQEDQLLSQLINEYSKMKISFMDLEIRKEFHVKDKFASAIEEFSKIQSSNSPLDKIYCIQSAISLIMKAISSRVKESSFSLIYSASDISLTTDDLLPILTFIIIYSKPNLCLYSNFLYMRYFHLNDSVASETGFSFVTFQAALEYLISGQLKNIKNTSLGSRFLEPNLFGELQRANHSNNINTSNNNNISQYSITNRKNSQGSFTQITPLENSKKNLMNDSPSSLDSTTSFTPLQRRKSSEKPPSVILPTNQPPPSLGNFLENLIRQNS